MILIKNMKVYAPDSLGVKDVLVSESILSIEKELTHFETAIRATPNSGVVIDGDQWDPKGCYLVPGFVDPHSHIIGGGGEGGFTTRTPELEFSAAVDAGLTTIIGVIGTDGTTRRMESLIAKANALTEQGLTVYCYTGSYQVPVRTLSGSITDDIILLDRVIGAGEIAISDHRSSCPTCDELKRLVSDARLGGMLSGKAGVVNIHMGDARDPFRPIWNAIESSAIPIRCFYPTHCNRNLHILEESVSFLLRGGNIDLTAEPSDPHSEEMTTCANAYRYLLDRLGELDPDHSAGLITFSTDAQGSLPTFDSEGRLIRIDVASPSTLLETVRELVVHRDIPLETALKPVTIHPSTVLKLHKKGRIEPGADADLLILNSDYQLLGVIAGGKILRSPFISS